MAKAALWSVTDAEARKRGEQTGLDTLVVHAVTLKEESVIYATSRQSAEARRNCSLTIYQTICAGTQSDMDS